ncbi:guanine nucleotide exchange C9orf72 homolog isoform X2 [Cryptotermes secundus]|uniref:guanine nucleotide exchange C9orf72 homolog isoform X2 n=1 Tax=Cryptotermes secundus TaxID=105785 RepID=UPI001454BB30|nr:guanine nucleotide exchange C9orf72 homolog isoform X2 [Cryptotermes secundus]
MVVMEEPFHSSNRISVPYTVENLVSNFGPAIKMDSGDICNIDSNSGKNVLPVLRSVAVSSNIASSAQEEVCHFFHVDTSKSNKFPAVSTADRTYLQEIKQDPPAEYSLPNDHGANSSVSYILPSEEDNIVSAVVLSKWDDIMGPQTVHVWLKDDADVRSLDSKSTLGQHTIRNMCLAKSVKYVTVHTVNCTGLNSVLSANYGSASGDLGQRSSGLFIVPELDLIAQSVVFQLQDHKLSVPYSLALTVSYQHYSYFLHLRQLCQHWLQRMAARLSAILMKCLSSNSKFEVSDQINGWMMDVCSMMQSLKSHGLATATHIQSYHVLSNPVLERVITSHLQTFGCTVVMGTSSEDINSGLLLNEFGCRELCSIELASNPYPVTAVDLTRGAQAAAVKQTPLRHHRWQVTWWEYHLLSEEGKAEGPRHPVHESMLHPVKEGASLVCSLLKDLRHLPPGLWLTYIQLFKQKLHSLAFNLLSLVCWIRNGSDKPGHCRYLAQALGLEEGDLLIVLAVAEKLQPGVYAFVMDDNSVPR